MDPATLQLIMPLLLGNSGGGSKGGQFGSQGAGTGILGAVQTIGSMAMMNKLRRTPRARYEITPEMQGSFDRAEGMARTGFTGGETAAFRQNLAQTQSAGMAGARQMGGGLGRAIFGQQSAMRLGALQNFAGQDAALMRQNMRYADSRGDVLSQQRNRQTAEDIAYRNMQEQNVGRSMQSGLTNMGSFLNQQQAFGLNKFGGGGSIPLPSWTNTKPGNPINNDEA
jgi:hypothetical protein